VLPAHHIDRVNGILMDLGVSSPQLEEAARGFSFRLDGPLDMRMDVTRGLTVAEWLATASENQIGEVIRTYGEERFAQPIARAIVAARSRGAINTTRELAQIVAHAVRTREPGQDPATRTFQALRIFINRELEELSLALDAVLPRLAEGGRLAVIAFHSLEDRLVKQFLRRNSLPFAGDAQLSRMGIAESALPLPPLRLIGRAIRASDAEVARNPRARSATLRVAERTAGAVS